MPIKKKSGAPLRRIIIWGAIAVLLILMLVSFPAPQNITEIVVYP